MLDLVRAIPGAALLFVLVCCSGSEAGTPVNCATKGSCPNSPAPNQSQIDTCQSKVDDPKCGARFQTYAACAFAQEKCDAAGVTDDTATRQSITSNCASEVSEYQGCLSASMPPPRTCGYSGAPCCTDGEPPCISTACCDPATNKCRGPAENCTADHTVCVANQCVACGGPNQPCCQIFGTSETNACPLGGCCYYGEGQPAGSCIPQGSMCRAATAMTEETVCRGSTCTSCGNTLETCCQGDKCTAANTVCSAVDTTCQPCGGSREPCCNGQCQFSGGVCTNGMCP